MGRCVGFSANAHTSVAEKSTHEEEYSKPKGYNSDFCIVSETTAAKWGGRHIPTEPITTPATFAGFLTNSAVALSVPAPPVPVVNGLFPPTPVLRISPPSAPVPAAADWACAKRDAVVAILPPLVSVGVGLFVKAETGMSAWEGALEASISAKEALDMEPDADPDAGPLVIDASPLDVPVVPVAMPPVVEALEGGTKTPPVGTVPV